MGHHISKLTVLDGGEWGIVADAVVDIGLGGEGNTLGDLLVLLVDLVRLLDDHIVTDLAELECRNADNAPLDQIFQNAKK